ncbi:MULTISPECIES: type ISP restriction/modification enzyme [unclassified Roseitalea]|uniref:DEAD/DEAH box helicase n=1 Tax=unclassified Roseitalea TaxID=2639107 RepID=UPI00273E3F82|nr:MULTISPECIES: type ISP restriction/modification enzyme [unclassified Roseitalea]
MSSDLRALLERFRETARTEREKGTYFENIVAVYLRHDPLQSAFFSKIETYEQWAKARGEDAADSGIDLVATLADGSGFCAVQCKFYDASKKVDKSDIDSFFTASGKEGFVRRLIVDTSDGNWTDRAEKALQGQTISTNRIGLSDLEASPILWSDFVRTGEVKVSEAKTLRQDQQEALEAVRTGLEEADRGKLILACGTGKTFTSLRIAEELVGRGGKVLFMVPSLALMSQAVREWTNDATLPLRSFAVCSDAKVGKRPGRQDTADIAVHDLAYPATTNGTALAEKMADAAPEAMTVVFATYQSIQVISAAQEAGLGTFNLIVCDEAHRTTGVTTGEEDESNFVRIHSDEHVLAAKRLYMTATPRIYGEAARQRAKEQSLTLAQMDDPATYGETLFERGFSWAVENELLTDYKVIVLAVDEGKVARSVQRRLETSDQDLALDDATKIVGCYKALTKTDLTVDVGTDTGAMQRALIFCRDIKSSKIIEGEFAAVAEEFRAQNPEDELTLDCEVRHVDGTFNADSRGRLLDWLKADPGDDNCRILTNARCLSEGVDVPALDGIMFLHPRKSQIDVVQSVGRVMRRAPGKRMGYVILPVAIPAGTSPEEALNDNERYRVVWQILNALRSHDERLDGDINKIHLGQTEGSRIEIVAVAPDLPSGTSSGSGAGIGQGSAPGDDEEGGGGRTTSQGELFVDEFSAAIRAQIVKKCGTKEYWDRWAADIARIAERHITRIEALLEDPDARATFDAFLKELHDDLNEAISEADAIEMLAQHIITRPVFESLFQGNRFTNENPISRAMQGIVARLDEARIDKEAESLEEFYASVRRRAEGLTDPAAKQKLIVQLYDDFFKSAFPRTTKRMGVVYTPVEIVDFILHSVDEALRRDFGVGIGAEGVHVIDPFTGTGTFVTRLLQSGLIAPEDLARKYREELHANEIILLAYYIAAINIETVYADLADEREGEAAYEPFTGILLTDTFALHEHRDMLDDLLPDNAERRTRQRNLDIRVIVGNPPYVVGEEDGNSEDEKVEYPKLDGRIRETYAARTEATLVNGLYNNYIRAIRWASDRLGEDGGVIAFVTNGGFLDGKTAAGLRRCLVEEFSDVRILDLKGNQRTQGERSKREGGKVFDSGSRAPIAISVLTKRPDSQAAGAIHYHDIGDYLSREDKLRIVRELGSAGGVESSDGWTTIKPDTFGDFLNKRDLSFDQYMLIGTKKKSAEATLFGVYSHGVSTGRGAWVINSSASALRKNVDTTIQAVSESLEGLQAGGSLVSDARRISWTRKLRQEVEAGRSVSPEDGEFGRLRYRPFITRHFLYHPRLNEERGQLPKLFPSVEVENRLICVPAPGNTTDFSCLIVDSVPDLEFVAAKGGSQCFPLHYYEEPARNENNPDLFATSDGPGLVRRDGITDEGLAHFQAAWPGEAITKEDLFHYVYGLLHSPDYRTRYADNLKKALPRIPAVASVEDYRAFRDAGRTLANLHVGYEEVEPYAATYREGDPRTWVVDEPEVFYRVEKMRFGGKRPNLDRTTIHYNDRITLTDVPEAAYRYVVNGKSAIEHVMERQSVTKDAYNPKTKKGSDIVNDANRFAIETMEDPEYPLTLLRRVITVSVETMRIVDALPPLRLPTEVSEAAE